MDAGDWRAIEIGIIGGLLTVAIMVIVGVTQKRLRRSRDTTDRTPE